MFYQIGVSIPLMHHSGAFSVYCKFITFDSNFIGVSQTYCGHTITVDMLRMWQKIFMEDPVMAGLFVGYAAGSLHLFQIAFVDQGNNVLDDAFGIAQSGAAAEGERRARVSGIFAS